MRRYLNQMYRLYQRPTLNGIDGSLAHRAASPLELFLDLIFVIAISKVATMLSALTVMNLFGATLLFIIIYTIWYTFMTYTAMFMKQEINYFLRVMIFIIMIPMIVLLSLNSLETRADFIIFCLSLASTKILLALVFRDSIVNAPINHITVSTVYLAIYKRQLISAGILLVAAFSTSLAVFYGLLLIVAINEVVITPKLLNRKLAIQRYPMPINYSLLAERLHLFMILVFGESLVRVVDMVGFNHGFTSIANVVFLFGSMYLFYLRISEESEHNQMYINSSLNMPNRLLTSYVILMLFTVLGQFGLDSNSSELKNPLVIVIITGLLSYICIGHLRYNLRALKIYDDPIERLFPILDIYTLGAMALIIVLFIFYHPSAFVVYLEVFIFFILHVIALPYRAHLIPTNCELYSSLTKQVKK